MKKIFLILLIFISLNVFSQTRNFKVLDGSFHKVEGCVTIPAYTDVNDMPMGVIKIIPENITEHERKRLVFESTLATEIKVEQKVGETWVYLTAHKTKFLRIKHPDFGVTEFDIPMEIEPNQCYEMVLSYLPPTTNTATEYAQLKKYHLIVKTDQPDATIYIDDEPLNTGVASKLVTEGTTHTYKIEYNLYHTETGFVTVNERTEIEKKLRPNFGYLNVTTSPEQGAKVYVDGNYIGVSPIKTDKLISGRHTVRVMKDKYKANIQYFEVVAGQTTDAKINMETNNTTNFITLNAAYSVAPQTSFGLTYGFVKKVGFFVSAMSNFNFMFSGKAWNEMYNENEVVFTGESSNARLSLTGGMMVKLDGPKYMKLGAGYGMRVKCWELNDEWYEYAPDTYKGVELTAGLMLNTNGLAISADVVTTNFKTVEIKLGIGINWN